MAKRTLLIGLAALAALVVAGPSSAAHGVAPIKGVVVGSQHGVVLVATPSGAVRTVRGHASVGTSVGMRVAVSGSSFRTFGRAHRTMFRGVVVRHTGSLTFLSAAQHMLVVHTGRRLSSAKDSTPPPGTVVQTTVGFDDQGDLDEQNEQELGQAAQAQVTATISAVGMGTVTLTVNGQQLTIPLPNGLTLPASMVGQQVTLSLSFANGQVRANEDDNDNDNEQGDDNDNNNNTTTTTVTTSPTTTIPITGDHHGDGGGDHHGDGGGGGND